MTMWQAIGAAGAAYLVLLARSAWHQGEFRQFLLSLALVAALCAAVGGTIAMAVLLNG